MLEMTHEGRKSAFASVLGVGSVTGKVHSPRRAIVPAGNCRLFTQWRENFSPWDKEQDITSPRPRPVMVAKLRRRVRALVISARDSCSVTVNVEQWSVIT